MMREEEERVERKEKKEEKKEGKVWFFLPMHEGIRVQRKAHLRSFNEHRASAMCTERGRGWRKGRRWWERRREGEKTISVV